MVKTIANKQFNQIKDCLPNPILPNHQNHVQCYWHAVELAFNNCYEPGVNSGLKHPLIDAAFNDNIFLWDTSFITFFTNLLHPYIPGISSLDNFYEKQFPSGEIPREIVRSTGEPFHKWLNTDQHPLNSFFHNHYGYRGLSYINEIPYKQRYFPDLGRPQPWPLPYLTLDAMNHPIAAWAEYESFLHTGDTNRLKRVITPLYNYYMAFYTYLRHDNNLYVTDWASMDNSPRNQYLGLAIDTSSEMVLFANTLIKIIDLIDDEFQRKRFEEMKTFLKDTSTNTLNAVNSLLWDKDSGFYYDYHPTKGLSPIKTIAGFWPLISGIADELQAEKLVSWLEDPQTFNRPHRVPVLAANEDGYDPKGGYWCGSVWAPTNTMVIYGLEKYGYHRLAKEIALNHLDVLVDVFEKTGSIWENYPAEERTSGNADHKNFVGWSGLAPILYLMRYKIGLNANASDHSVTWNVDVKDSESGCERYWFFNKTADFKQKQKNGVLTIDIMTNDSFDLIINYLNKSRKYTIIGNTSIIIGTPNEKTS